MTYVYLDLNVIDKIEKKNNLDEQQRTLYLFIERLITDNVITCPYSNAHISDLLRGHEKNPTYIPKHLETLKRVTNNLALVQYWGDSQAIWHYRDVEEFFNSALADKEDTAKSFIELADCDETGLMRKFLESLSRFPIPSGFKEIYKANTIFNQIYPRTRTEMTFLSLCEDLYDFSINARKDYSLYKSLRTYVNQAKAKLKAQQKMLSDIEKTTAGTPSYLNFDETWEKYAPKTKTSENPAFQKITDTYCKIDFKGFKSDEKFSNLIDDSLHVFYGAHCDYFVTIDDRCHYKAAETYHKLGIATKAVKPVQFMNSVTTTA